MENKLKIVTYGLFLFWILGAFIGYEIFKEYRIGVLSNQISILSPMIVLVSSFIASLAVLKSIYNTNILADKAKEEKIKQNILLLCLNIRNLEDILEIPNTVEVNDYLSNIQKNFFDKEVVNAIDIKILMELGLLHRVISSYMTISKDLSEDQSIDRKIFFKNTYCKECDKKTNCNFDNEYNEFLKDIQRMESKIAQQKEDLKKFIKCLQNKIKSIYGTKYSEIENIFG